MAVSRRSMCTSLAVPSASRHSAPATKRNRWCLLAKRR
jgi:hypothetical protein